MRSVFGGLWLTCILIAMPGCSAGDGSLARVTGEVTLNGLPAAAEILFQPEDDAGRAHGRASSAFSDASGHFELNYSADRDGAEIGRHRVSVKILRTHNRQSDTRDDATTYDRAMVPLKAVRLTRVVHPGENHFRFAVTF